MKTGDTVTTMTGKTGPIVGVDEETVSMQITCCLIEHSQRGQKPSKKKPIVIKVRYHRDDVRKEYSSG